MIKITVKVEGMACGMCEAHINDAIRKNIDVKKVTASHKSGQVIVLTESDISDEKLRDIIDETGYSLISVTREAYEKKSLFHRK